MRRASILLAALLAPCLSVGWAHAQAATQPGGVGYSPGAGYDMLSWGVFVTAVTPSGKSGAPTFESWRQTPKPTRRIRFGRRRRAGPRSADSRSAGS